VSARYQTSFWKEFIKAISVLGSEAYKYQKITQFKGVFMRLIELCVKHFEVQSHVFLDFNTSNTSDDQFDEYFNNKRDLGKIIRATA
jgi:hypothetical protein